MVKRILMALLVGGLVLAMRVAADPTPAAALTYVSLRQECYNLCNNRYRPCIRESSCVQRWQGCINGCARQHSGPSAASCQNQKSCGIGCANNYRQCAVYKWQLPQCSQTYAACQSTCRRSHPC